MVPMDPTNCLNEVPHACTSDPQKLVEIVQACCWIHPYDVHYSQIFYRFSMLVIQMIQLSEQDGHQYIGGNDLFKEFVHHCELQIQQV